MIRRHVANRNQQKIAPGSKMARAVLALTALLGAATASAVDLMDIYRDAVNNDARYSAARAQFRAMQERVPQARAGVAPRSQSEGAYTRYLIGAEAGPAYAGRGREPARGRR